LLGNERDRFPEGWQQMPDLRAPAAGQDQDGRRLGVVAPRRLIRPRPIVLQPLDEGVADIDGLWPAEPLQRRRLEG